MTCFDRAARALLATLLFAASTASAAAAAAPASIGQGNTRLSNASQWAANGSAVVLSGAMLTVAASGAVIVASVETVGDASVVVLTSVADGSRATLRLSGEAAHAASVVAGVSVEVVVQSSGYLLVAAGKVLAFVPNELGRALLHNSRVAARG